MAGLVYVDGRRVDKPGAPVDIFSEITVKEEACPYVSRGGLKLEKALKAFDISRKGPEPPISELPQGDLPTVCFRRGLSAFWL